MFKKYYDRLLEQISIDYNCTPEDLRTKKIIITKSAWNNGRRSYSPGVPFLQIATLGERTVIMADECLHEFFSNMVKDVEAHRLLEFDNLLKLNEEVKKHGYY